jgi:hypothetical protein
MKGFSLRKSPSCADFMEFVDVFFVDEAGQLSLAKFWPVQRLAEASFGWRPTAIGITAKGKPSGRLGHFSTRSPARREEDNR